MAPSRVAETEDVSLNLQIGLTPPILLLAGIPILVMPRLLNDIVATDRIIVGVVGVVGVVGILGASDMRPG